jgi:DNA-binding transcriptional MocR family regulator
VLRGVALNSEGLDPDDLARAAVETQARLLFTTPTLQNPTTSIMSEARRRAVVDVARAHDLLIVEDDIYAPFAVEARGLPPLAVLAPERTFYVGSASKAIAPGLRAGWLLPPNAGDWRDRILARLRVSTHALPAFGHALLSQWIEDGTADHIAGAVRDDVRRRVDTARSVLGSRIVGPPAASSPHVWIPLPPVEAERCFARAIGEGIALTPPSAITIDGSAVSGLRICLGAATDESTLERALRTLAGVLEGGATSLERSAL